MNVKRFIWASLAVFAAFQIVDFPIHSFILGPFYQSLQNLWRQDMMSIMWVMLLAYLAMSFLFVYIFTKNYESKGLGEGLRFGLVIGLFYQIPHILGQYVAYPIPLALALIWLVVGIVEFMVMGIVAALVYKK